MRDAAYHGQGQSMEIPCRSYAGVQLHVLQTCCADDRAAAPKAGACKSGVSYLLSLDCLELVATQAQ